ncbi:MAG: hypothetical protein ACRDBP_18975 [Luteolibacter sp.]
MKPILSAITLLCLISSLGFAEESKDLRFTNGPKNVYVEELSDVVAKAFKGKRGLLNLQKVAQVGNAHFVDFSIAFRPEPAIPPVTEKDFEKLKGFIDPFFKGQVELYKKAGKEISSTSYSFPLPEHAEGYTKDELPTMFFSIDGKDTDLFLMKVSFTERKDDVLVILFTIVAVE